MTLIAERANQLGRHVLVNQLQQRGSETRPQQKKPIRMTSINEAQARTAMREVDLPSLTPFNVDEAAEAMNALLYNLARDSQQQQQRQRQQQDEGREEQPYESHDRWTNLLTDSDPRALWQAINWNGTSMNDLTRDRPSDDAFREHFEELLNPTTEPNQLMTESTAAAIYLPVTDDPIQPQEVMEAMKSLKKNKSGGPSGVPPGFLKLMPPRWIIFLATFFPMILMTSIYPCMWSYTKLIVLFKKGSRNVCTNYRGISLMDSLAKLFDSILSQRLERWFQPDREQAGAQKGRGCVEHLLTLRLLMDFAKHRKRKLFVVFVDFSKAYDCVPRDRLIRRMISLGCGATMIRIVTAIYNCTKMILRQATITATIGVRQGSPTSCLLFTLLVNDLIRNLKERCLPDDFLGWLHALMLMDDTVILATSRERAIEKLEVLHDFCADSGMIINESKTKFMVVNGDYLEKQKLEIQDLSVQNCQSYTYLGCIFTQDGKTTSAVEAQCKSKWPHVAKFEAFVKKNCDSPYAVKETVFSAALTSAILYGMETWLSNAAIEAARPIYTQCIRLLLGVRRTTAGDLCLIEADQPSLIHRVKCSQKKTIEKLILERENINDDPFGHVWSIVRNARTPCAKYILALANYDAEEESARFKEKILSSTRTKYQTYRTWMNPELKKHPMYSDRNVREYQRLTTTRFRLSSHCLEIEKGRWTRKPKEERLCPSCCVVQDEQHALKDCQQNSSIRQQFANADLRLPHVFATEPTHTMTSMCHDLLKNFM